MPSLEWTLFWFCRCKIDHTGIRYHTSFLIQWTLGKECARGANRAKIIFQVIKVGNSKLKQNGDESANQFDKKPKWILAQADTDDHHFDIEIERNADKFKQQQKYKLFKLRFHRNLKQMMYEMILKIMSPFLLLSIH